MAPPKTFHGGRAKISIQNLGDNSSTVIGIWTSFDYNVAYDVQAVYILGRFSAAELVTTGIEPVSIDCSGFKIVNHGFFKEGKLTPLVGLLNQEGLELTVTDRTGKIRVAVIHGCKPTGTSMSVSAKQLATGRNSYIGLLMDEDEEFFNDEASDTSVLP